MHASTDGRITISEVCKNVLLGVEPGVVMETVVAVGVVAFPEASGGDTEKDEILLLIVHLLSTV